MMTPSILLKLSKNISPAGFKNLWNSQGDLRGPCILFFVLSEVFSNASCWTASFCSSLEQTDSRLPFDCPRLVHSMMSRLCSLPSFAPPQLLEQSRHKAAAAAAKPAAFAGRAVSRKAGPQTSSTALLAASSAARPEVSRFARCPPFSHQIGSAFQKTRYFLNPY